MNPTLVIAAVAVAIVVIATLLHLVLSAALQRHKWVVALRTARDLLKKRNSRAIQRVLDSDSPGERLGAAMAFSEVKTRAATQALCRTLAQDRDAEVRSAAANALGRRADAQVIAALSDAATDDKSAVVRGAALEALGMSRSETAGTALVAALRDAGARPWRPGLRARLALGTMAADSLGKIGGKEAIAALGAAQTSRHGAIRDAAQEALSLIELRQVASNEEADAATLRKLAAAYIVKRDFAEAVYWLERAGSSDPTNAETHETLGTLHQKLGDHRRAERSYRKAIELAPQEPFPHFGVGTICHKRGDRAGAIAAFERYLELAPDGDQAASARGFLTELTQD